MSDQFRHATGPNLEPLRLAIRRLIEPLPPFLREFLMFGMKQAWACLFAGIMLSALIVTSSIWKPDWPVHRYDALFALAIVTQLLFLALKLESFSEVKVIFAYHLTGTIMEIFKVHMGSWSYPEPSLFNIAGVPLFSGFMYGTIGSFMARAIRVFDMRFSHYPPFWITVVLAMAIYVNFFTHHFLPDMRYPLMAATLIIYARVWISLTPDQRQFRMPLALSALLTAIFLWIAENIGTLSGTWLYPSADGWHPVSFGKFGSWYLLIYVSFVLVTIVVKPQPPDEQARA